MKRTRVLLLAFALIALGGASYGLKETVTHHYPAFEARFPHADQSWWNPALSWHSKYEGGIPAQGPAFWGSTTVFVFVTDAYHLLGELERIFTRCGFVTLAFSGWNRPYIGGMFLRNISTAMAAGWVVWAIGFHIVYTFIF